nr:unnamed protein product [Callosobruchus analis]
MVDHDVSRLDRALVNFVYIWDWCKKCARHTATTSRRHRSVVVVLLPNCQTARARSRIQRLLVAGARERVRKQATRALDPDYICQTQHRHRHRQWEREQQREGNQLKPAAAPLEPTP